MVDLDKAKDFIVTAAKGVSTPAIQAAAQNIGVPKGISLSSFVIPLATDDPNVERIVKEFDLQNPENMIKFFVEAHFAEFDCIYEGFSDLKQLDLGNSTAKVDAARNEYIRGMENPEDRKDCLKSAAHDLGIAFSELEGKVLNSYIAKVRQIDDARSNRFKSFWKSKGNLKDIDTNNHCAKVAINAIMEAVNLQILISSELGINISGSVIASFERFKTKLLAGNNCKLMHDYDDDSDTEFWLKLPDRMDNALKTADKLESMLETADEGDLDFDNITFN